MHSNSTCKRTAVALGCVLLFISSAVGQKSVSGGQPKTPVTFLDSNKVQDGLAGSIRRVKTEVAKVQLKDGRIQEGPLQLLELTTYSLDGNRIENVTYPVQSAPVGKEEYRYDAKGNIVEMTLRANDGSIISREAYEYEFDRFGNWKKMVTSLVLFEGGELKREPVEVIHRTLAYYYDDAVASIVEGAALPTMPAVPPALGFRALRSHDVAPSGFQPALTENPRVQLDEFPPEFIPVKQVEVVESRPDVAVLTAKQASEPPTASVAEDTNISTTNRLGKRATGEAPPTVAAEGDTVGTRSVNASVSKAHALFETGMMKFEAGDEKGAVAAYLESLQLEPDSAQVNLSLGHAYIRLKKYDDAIKALKNAVSRDPDLAEAHYGLGYSHYQQKQFPDAVKSFKRATALRPEMAKGHFGLALSYQQLADENGLMKQYRILQRLEPSLAKKLKESFPDYSNMPCGSKPFCN